MNEDIDRLRVALGVVAILLIAGTARANDAKVDYLRDVKPIFKAHCYACHGALKQESGLRLDAGELIRQGGDSGPAVAPGDVEASLLVERITAADDSERMPPEGEKLKPEEIRLIDAWIVDGARSPPDERPESDPRDHWSFQRVQPTSPPADGVHPVDAFVRRRLRQAGLQASPPTDAVTLIRRMFLDLHGLPPTPEQVKRWRAELSRRSHKTPISAPPRLNDESVARLIDELLSSPRYGERWAQHWLDVVRYADTHGFEVNTPRPNAWPYRDYVIRAFNEDKPFDEFVFEQLAGDSVFEDAATGFMVAAAVLLPGQIGADDESKRLARQDALDEIIVGTGATFLGLTIGCARCHDHKFDPITQQEYYKMQAFFAGVEYGDREILGVSHARRLKKRQELAPKVAALQAALRQYRPFAYSGRTITIDDEDATRVTSLAEKNGHGDNPAGSQRGYRDDFGSASRIANLSRRRYTWWKNRSGEDTFTWNPSVSGRFRLWISWGVHGSGVHTRDARYVLDRDGNLETKDDQQEVARADQFYFSGMHEGESEKKPLWSGLFDTGTHDWTESTRLILRGGDTGTGITADVIVLQEELPPPRIQTADDSSPRLPRLRRPASPLHNVERFAATAARFVRFTSFETMDNNRHEPCIDELEVFSAGDAPRNVALASSGAKPSSSGNYSETGSHQLKHVNDGKYGNSHSWISNQQGRGWVQLEFAKAETIDRVEWGRDRTGKFKDRLAVRYRIDVSLDGARWTTVAQSDDRMPIGTPFDDVTSLQRNAPAKVTSDLAPLVEQLESLKMQLAELETPPMVYGGTFRSPDVTYVLNRGDPEQRMQQVGPRVPELLGELTLPHDAPEQERRIALAKWIASDKNPLTARVMVSRIWQYHFGRGIVETGSDFGTNGARPSHPQLIDWLAHEFVDSGWSIKHLHRLILTSDTYRQSSRVSANSEAIDADCKLLWRFPSRRQEAESIRDSILYVSGQLNLQMGGPGYNFFKSRGGLSGFPPIERFGPAELRRMIYAHKIRMEPVPIFGAFDCPDGGQAKPRRSRSTTAIQALNLFNSPFVLEQADVFARRIEDEVGSNIERQVELAYSLTVSRSPSDTERQASITAVSQSGLATLCRVLFNSNEFLFLP